MKKQILAAGAAMGLAFTGLAPAALAEVPITLNAGAARWYFSSDRELKDMNTPFVGLEWAFSDRWAAEVSYAQDDADNEAVPGSSTEVVLANLGMRLYGGSYIGGGGRLRPYAVLGAGYFSQNPNFSGGEKTEDTTINAGLGVRWMMTSRFGASLDGRTVYNVDKSNNDTIAYLGLNYYLGNVDPAPIPAPTACVDDDGDGVCDDVDACLGTPPNTRVDATGCPLPVAQVASIKLKVNFAFDSSKVQEQYFNDLGELAKFLKRFDQVDVSIDGHTDSVGPDTYNQQLSQRRAQAVVDMLVNTYGIAPSRLKAVGYGESQPVASNDTAEGRAENRRVMASLEVEYSE
ncbi:MAG: OmpA family protein [Gammaproteobacteria bacterium]|nr:OmpA family protein [Gammaproteobacteria bacterium]